MIPAIAPPGVGAEVQSKAYQMVGVVKSQVIADLITVCHAEQPHVARSMIAQLAFVSGPTCGPALASAPVFAASASVRKNVYDSVTT
jgi:hypothetical protein